MDLRGIGGERVEGGYDQNALNAILKELINVCVCV